MLYKEVFTALNKAKVKYAVAGGVAVVLHGYRRTTDDLDLIVVLEKNNLAKFFDALTQAGYMPKVPVLKEQFVEKKNHEKWKKEKGMVVFSFVEKEPPFQLIDVFVNEYIDFKDVYKRSIKTKVEGIEIPIISIVHLMQLKKIAGRPQDQIDLVQLEEIERRSTHDKKKNKNK